MGNIGAEVHEKGRGWTHLFCDCRVPVPGAMAEVQSTRHSAHRGWQTIDWQPWGRSVTCLAASRHGLLAFAFIAQLANIPAAMLPLALPRQTLLAASPEGLEIFKLRRASFGCATRKSIKPRGVPPSNPRSGH
jgi:hypothetical protein